MADHQNAKANANQVVKPTPKPKRKPRTRKKKKWQTWQIHTLIYASLVVLFLLFHYRDGIRFLLLTAYESVFEKAENKKITVHDVRAIEILEKHDEHLFGFDVSHYQEDIDWKATDSLYKKFPADFVFIRSTMGEDGTDYTFAKNWKRAKTRLLIRGAYHYYRPDENSTLQAQNYIKNTPLEPGDFIPVLDIEDYPKTQSVEKLKEGITNWLTIVEKHYGVKPMIYTGENFYKLNLANDFANYKIWIAKYSLFSEKIKDDWHFWQFTDKGSVPGIKTDVDLNIFNGDRQDIKAFLMQ